MHVRDIPCRDAGKRPSAAGQSLVEFSLISPILIVLIFGIIDFGIGFYSWITITNAAREGARIAAIRAPEDEVTQRVEDAADPLPASDLTITVTNAQGSPGESVVVDVDYEYSLLTPLDAVLGLVSGGSVGPTLTISTSTDMRLE